MTNFLVMSPEKQSSSSSLHAVVSQQCITSSPAAFGRTSPHSAPTEISQVLQVHGFYPLDSLAGSCNCIFEIGAGLQRVKVEKKSNNVKNSMFPCATTPLGPEERVSGKHYFAFPS